MTTNQFSLEGKVALVTGASSGIGKAVAKGLSAAGAMVAVAARRTNKLDEVVAEITAEGGKAIAVELDVTSTESILHAFDEIENTLGTVSVLVNNAGIADAKNFLKYSMQDLESLMNTNFKGSWQVAQEASRRLIAAGKAGSIINLSSVLGDKVQIGQSAYSASKGAVNQMTRGMAVDLMSYNIRVNAIAPGWFKTEMNDGYLGTEAAKAYIQQTPSRRLGDLNELIGPVIFLASDASSFVNGVILPIDGALHAYLR